MIMTLKQLFKYTVVGAALMLGTASINAPVVAQELGMEKYLGVKAPQFADPAAAVDAFKAALAANDLDGVARMLGLDPVKLKDA
jgi:hypothetical protein